MLPCFLFNLLYNPSFYIFLIFCSRYSFNTTALLNFSSFVLYNKVIDLSSAALSKTLLTDSLFFSNSLKYFFLNSSHFFSSCENHFLNEELGAISFSHKSIFTSSLRNPRGQSLSISILKLSSLFSV